MANGGARPNSGRKLSPRTAQLLAAVALGCKPAAVAHAHGVSVHLVYAACRYHRMDSTRWRSHKVLKKGKKQ
jgi:hypothetical protein